MKKIGFLLVLMGLSYTSTLNAQDVNSMGDGSEEFEGIRIGARDYSRNKPGFFAPYDQSLGIAYDYETLRFSYDNISNKPLNGGRVTFMLRGPLSKRSVLSLELPMVFRYNHTKDNQIYDYESIERKEFGFQGGLLLCTGYRIGEKCYFSISGGAKFELIMDNTTLKTNSGKKIEYGGYREDFKLIDVPLCFSASFRYKRFGVYASYDIGTINRYKDAFYDETGYPKSYTKKTNHFSIGLHYFIL